MTSERLILTDLFADGLQNSFWRSVKRLADLLIAASLLAFICIPCALVIVLVRRDGGPAFFGQKRIGKNGKVFLCWKFRTMVVDADKELRSMLDESASAKEEWTYARKLKNDPRITSLGRFLRKSSIDELPQLYNVLRGDMSLVGPRPIIPSERHCYKDHWAHYVSVRPGISGLWQVSGRNTLSYAQRVALDVRYVKEWSLWLDVLIMLKTPFVVLGRKGAY